MGTGDLRIFLTLALTGLVTNTTLWYYGLHRTLAINAAILGAMGPVFVALLSATWLRERLSRLNVLGILVSSAGVVLTVTRGSLRALLDLDLHPGDFFILAGAEHLGHLLRLRAPGVPPVSPDRHHGRAPTSSRRPSWSRSR